MDRRTVDPRSVAVAAAGGLLAGATQLVARVRQAAKPLHPEGELFAGRLVRHGRGETGAPATGVDWLDASGEDRVEARLSRAVGLPDGLPDVHGLALRVHLDSRPADVLFATTGTGRLGRFLLTASRDPAARPMTTLLPYRTAAGPVLLCLEAVSSDTRRLSWARADGPWHEFATLELEASLADPPISFDPILQPVPGLDQYPAVVRLREPAYRRARRTRNDSAPSDVSAGADGYRPESGAPAGPTRKATTMDEAAQDRAAAAELPEGDVIRVLLEQHAQIRELFAQVKRANGPEKKDAFDSLRALLAVHETAEELVLRPVSAETAGQHVVDARNREEADANAVLADLEDMDLDDPEFDIRLEAFRKSVDEHAEAEESDEFPAVLAQCDEDRRRDLGTRIKAAEALAPTHPHPGSDPGSTKQKLVGPFASMVDRAKDALSRSL